MIAVWASLGDPLHEGESDEDKDKDQDKDRDKSSASFPPARGGRCGGLVPLVVVSAGWGA